MPRNKKATLRQFFVQEQYEPTQICRSRVTPAVEVLRAEILLAVARGDDYQAAARSVSRRSGDAVPHLVARSNAEGTAIRTTRRRLGSS